MKEIGCEITENDVKSIIKQAYERGIPCQRIHIAGQGDFLDTSAVRYPIKHEVQDGEE